MKKRNSGWYIFWIMLSVAIVTGFILLYQYTDFAKRFVEWWTWFYNGLKDFNWNNQKILLKSFDNIISMGVY